MKNMVRVTKMYRIQNLSDIKLIKKTAELQNYVISINKISQEKEKLIT